MIRNKLTKQNILEIKKLYEDGTKVREIAKRYKVNPSTISYWINDGRRKERNQKIHKKFMSLPLPERRKVYQKRNFYMSNYRRKRYRNDPEFREMELKRSRESYKKLKGGQGT